MEMRAAAHKRRRAAALILFAWVANFAVIVGFWLYGNVALFAQPRTGLVLVALARLLGLTATYCILVQLVLMGRQGWLEPVFGLDKLAIFHRRNGTAALLLILFHPILLTLGYGSLSGTDLISQFFQLLGLPFVLLAETALLLLITTVSFSGYAVRVHLKFEVWHAIHLLNYSVVGLIIWHQLANGADLVGGPVFYWYWVGLYVFAVGNILWWRWLRPVLRWWRFRFAVEKVVPETSTATSVYITGRNLERFKAKGGQFVMVRFWQKGLRWQEHPFSLSMLPNKTHFRLTIRQQGDFTNAVPTVLRPGTSVIVSGPHGAYTHDKAWTNDALYVAGGIGITPIRSLIEERALWQHPGKTTLLFGNRTEADTALLAELQALGKKLHMPIYNVLSEQRSYKGEKGYIDAEKIARLVPDVARRDVFVCGPPPMMQGVIAALKAMGVPPKQIHYERFALHKG